MTTPTSNEPSDERKRLLDAVHIQLSSQRPSDVLDGIEQVRLWLRENIEDREVYGMLLNVVKENHDLREQVRLLLIEMSQNGSMAAQEALAILPSSVQDLLADAEDAYYAAEYEKAIKLYRQVLRLEPDNPNAQDHLTKAIDKQAKAKSKQGSGNQSALPRDAVQYYRRARSFIAARDFLTAMKLLDAAIEAAQARGMSYPDAEQLIDGVQDLLLADEFKQKAYHFSEKKKWKDALDLINRALTLGLADENIKKEFQAMQAIMNAEFELQKRGAFGLFGPLGPLQKAIQTARGVIDPHDPLLKIASKNLIAAWLIRIGLAVATVAIFLTIFSDEIIENIPLTHPKTAVPSISTVVIGSPIVTPFFVSETPTIMDEPPIILPTQTPHLATFTPEMNIPTLEPKPVGYIIKAYVSAWDNPDGALIGNLGLYQAVTILEERPSSGSIWYRCSWEEDGQPKEGWICSVYSTRVSTASISKSESYFCKVV